MSFLSMTEAKLPPGFRFHPRDEELVSDYLAAKAASGELDGFPALMINVDLNKCEPWNLPNAACVGGKEWYFYTSPDKKYASGQRTNRATFSGYWKATGKDRPVVDPRLGRLVGMRKTLVFYHGRAPRGTKTDWVLHEFRLEASNTGATASFSPKEDWVLCRIFQRSRGLSSKVTAEDSHDEAGPSSFLPADAFTSSGEQALVGIDGGNQLAAASSSGHPLGQQPPWWSLTATSHVPHTEEHTPETMNMIGFVHPEATPDMGSSYVDPLFYKKKAILNYLSRLDVNPRTEGISGGYSSEARAPNTRNQSFWCSNGSAI